MAINLEIENEQGVSASHNVFNIEYNNSSNNIAINHYLYINANKFNNGKKPLEWNRKVYLIEAIPIGIKNKLKNALEDFEDWLIANDSEYTNGIRVKDNGENII